MYHATQPQLVTKKLLVQERGWFYVVFIIFVNVIGDHFILSHLFASSNNKDLKSSRTRNA
ncbi:hypothetical protein NC651_004471 [Populus alba x Populus x berolinensis]|nr:hypothetical protein NC651_004471 [Populus alba x Populus x berolinensis]